MAQQDIYNDVTPRLMWQRPSNPSIAALKTALSGFNSTSYSADRLNLMSERDMVYAARVHGLTVASPQSV